MRVSGLMINYYFVCKRKLWCLAKNINFEETNENVQLGKLIDENSYSYETRQIMIENTVNIDFIRKWKVVHEVKKSKAIEESAIWQVKYYIYFLKKRGIDIEKGIIDYPEIKERKEILFSNEDERKIEEILLEIEKICSREKAPKVINEKICKKCSYYEFCYI